MADSFSILQRLDEYNKQIRISLKKIKKKTSNLDVTKLNPDDMEKIAEYYDEIKVFSIKSIKKCDNLIDECKDSSDELSSLTSISGFSSDED